MEGASSARLLFEEEVHICRHSHQQNHEEGLFRNTTNGLTSGSIWEHLRVAVAIPISAGDEVVYLARKRLRHSNLAVELPGDARFCYCSTMAAYAYRYC